MQAELVPLQGHYRGPTHDKRTRKWRAVRDAIASLTAQAGDVLTDAQRERIARAAELGVLAQEARRAALSDPNADRLNGSGADRKRSPARFAGHCRDHQRQARPRLEGAPRK